MVKILHKMLSCKPYMYWGVKQTTECLNFFLVEYKRHVIYVSVVVQLNINYRIESVNIVILLYQKQDSNINICLLPISLHKFFYLLSVILFIKEAWSKLRFTYGIIHYLHLLD